MVFQTLIILFIVVPLVELGLLIQVGQWMGVFNTIMLVLLTGVLGAYLAKSQGLLVLSKIQRELEQGIMPSDSLFDGVLILIGGVLLLTPGLITDALGFFLLIPQGRALIKNWLKKKIEDQYRRGKTIRIHYF